MGNLKKSAKTANSNHSKLEMHLSLIEDIQLGFKATFDYFD